MEIARDISDVVIDLLRPYSSRICLFGSMARGDFDEHSDIDILLDLRSPESRPPLGLRWFDLERQLSDALGRPVELVSRVALSLHLKPFIEREEVVLYED